MSQAPGNTPRARVAYGYPQHPTDPLTLRPSERKIQFLHPGYSEPHSRFLSLPALDNPDGIHHQTALDACAIVAGNRWDGFLTLDREGTQRVPTTDMEISLSDNEYYFQVPASDGAGLSQDYPLVPTFAEWRFPHNNLPAHWRHDPLHDPTTQRCLLSGSVSLIELAHIIPQRPLESNWFRDNQMINYGAIHSPKNILTFKVDVHQFFDRKPKFAIVPKYGQMVAHMFGCETCGDREAIELYHNVPVTISVHRSEFLLARFAWTIFPLLEDFLLSGKKRRLLRKTSSAFEAREEDGDGCHRAWMSAQRSSASPKKRARDGTGEGEEEEGEDEYGLWAMGNVRYWEELNRGRKRVCTISGDRGMLYC